MSKFYLDVQEITKIYGKKKPFTAVDGITFQLKPQEILGLLGPNGSGKTTTIQMLLGTLTPTRGTIQYFGKDFQKNRSETLQRVSFASTYTSLPYILTVDENLKCFGLYYGIKNFEKTANPLLERFGMIDKKKSQISSLSAGQITRLMLVKAFFTQPHVVLLDEPTASLDPDVSDEVCKFLLEERKRTGLSILFTSHKMEEVAELCDRAIFLKKGKIIANDIPKNLARSVSLFELRLTIVDGMKQAVLLAEGKKFHYEIEHRNLSIQLDDTEIPPLLTEMMKSGVSYASIQIKEPSLEDFFIKISGGNS